MDYAVANGIISENQFTNYNANATRRQFAAILAKALPASELPAINTVRDNSLPDVPDSMEDADSIYMLYRAGILTGNDRFGTFAPDTAIGRSSVAAIVTRMVDVSERKTFELAEAPIYVSTVTLNTNAITLNEEAVYTLSASYAPENAQNKYVT